VSVLRLQHIGVALADYEPSRRDIERAGFPTRDFRDDQGKGFQHDSRVLLGNECWLHVVYNWNRESRVNRFLTREGPGLEHLALETDDIEADVRRLRELGVPLFEDKVFDANDGYEAFVYPDDAVGFTVELIQPHENSWGYPADAGGKPVSNVLGVEYLHSVSAGAEEPERSAQRFAELFGLPHDGAEVSFANRCVLRFVESPRAGLETLHLGSRSPERDAEHFDRSGFPKAGSRWSVAGVGLSFVSI
jgi:methylmalonyl-CoA/ethylmalonyl-CoA epimerase